MWLPRMPGRRSVKTFPPPKLIIVISAGRAIALYMWNTLRTTTDIGLATKSSTSQKKPSFSTYTTSMGLLSLHYCEETQS